MSIIGRVTSLGLPLEDCIVIGSGVLDVLGLRAAQDIDLVVKAELFEWLREKGEYQLSVRHGEEVLEKGDQEIWLTWGSMEGVVYDFAELFHHSVVIEGVRFASPEFVLAWKRAAARPKDAADIVLLEDYLKFMK